MIHASLLLCLLSFLPAVSVATQPNSTVIPVTTSAAARRRLVTSQNKTTSFEAASNVTKHLVTSENTADDPENPSSTTFSTKEVTSGPAELPDVSEKMQLSQPSIGFGLRSPIHRIEESLTEQYAILMELKRQLNEIGNQQNNQQKAIDRLDKIVEDHSWGIADLKLAVKQSDTSISNIKHLVDMNRVNATVMSSLGTRLSDLETKVTVMEDLQLATSQVLQHVVAEDIWFNSSLFESDSLETNQSMASASSSITLSEQQLQIMEERTNEVDRHTHKWKQVEQALHTSISQMERGHWHQDSQLASLSNYTLNNGRLISELARARIEDGAAIVEVYNATKRVGNLIELVQQLFEQDRNRTSLSHQGLEKGMVQLLDLIQLNSDKISTVQTYLTDHYPVLESHVAKLTSEVGELEGHQKKTTSDLELQLRNVSERLQANKERGDMLWSRVRIIDDRLAHVEVRYLTEELDRYKKNNDDLRQNIRLMEIDDILSDLNTKQRSVNSTAESLGGKLGKLEGSLFTLESSLKSIQTSWTQLNAKLPALTEVSGLVESLVSALPADCSDAYARGFRQDGEQLLRPSGTVSIWKALCHMTQDGGWTVLQRRFSGSINFNRNWAEYKTGFGVAKRGHEFWAGNQLIHLLTSQGNYSAMFEMVTTNGSYYYAQYDRFRVLAEEQMYKLLVSGYSGNATDSLKHSNGVAFSTMDVDNDGSSTHCAQFYTSGWWYKHCQYCNLNGRYTVGVVWFNHQTDEWMELKQTTIKIKRRDE